MKLSERSGQHVPTPVSGFVSEAQHCALTVEQEWKFQAQGRVKAAAGHTVINCTKHLQGSVCHVFTLKARLDTF